MNLNKQIQGHVWIIIMALASLLGPVVWASESQPAGFELSSTELMKHQSDGVVIIDIRRKEEWRDTGILNGAETITAFTKAGSLHPDFQTKFASLVPNSDTPFVLYCRSGRRSGLLRDALEKNLGFTKAMHLLGGIVAWKKEGKSLVPYGHD
jgi:rhodanese-related sulfurtransferase